MSRASDAKRLAKRGLQRAVKAAAVGADVVRAPRAGVVVLIYHRVGGGSGLEVDLPAPVFDEQMAALAASGRVVTLGEALERLAAAVPVSASAAAADADAGDDRGGCVVVTFDDGTADFADVAVPILERHGVPATLYVATAFVDEQREFPWGAPPASWSALADACTTGVVDVGSHTHRHRLLDRLPPSEIDDELDRSIGLIEEHLGWRPHDFAYPKAVMGSAAAAAAVERRFRSAALAGTRPNVPGRADPQRLARSPVQTSDGMAHFHRKVAGGMGLEDTLRRLLNRSRYSGATT